MKKNSLTTALLAGLAGAAGLSTAAHAINVNPDNLENVLEYPYYRPVDPRVELAASRVTPIAAVSTPGAALVRAWDAWSGGWR